MAVFLFDDWSGESKRCLDCKEIKPLDAFYACSHGAQKRAARCKDCLRPWHEAYYQKRAADDPSFRATRNEKRKKWYRELTQEEKRAFMKKLRDRHESVPSPSLTRNLCRALRRRPTDNPVTLKELLAIWDAQDGKCALSGITMTWGKGAYCPTSMSIDRIDCNRGYEKDNVRLVCYAVNTFRGRWSDEVVLAMAKAIVAHMEKPEQQPFAFVA